MAAKQLDSSEFSEKWHPHTSPFLSLFLCHSFSNSLYPSLSLPLSPHTCRPSQEARGLPDAQPAWQAKAGAQVYGGAERDGRRLAGARPSGHRHDATRTEVGPHVTPVTFDLSSIPYL